MAIVFLMCVASNASLAQDGYQRFYPTEDRALLNVGSIPTDDGGFFMLNVGIDNTNPTVVDKLQLSKNNPKGNLIWTKEYTIIDQTLITNLKSVDFVNLVADTLIIGGVALIQGVGLDDDKFIMKVDPNNGDLLWSGTASDKVEQEAPFTLPIVLNGYDNSFVSYNTHGSTTGDSFAIQRIHYNELNQVIDQKAYYPEGLSAPNAIAGLVDAGNTVDSNTVISYVPSTDQTSTAILTLDRNGEMLNSVRYSISPDSIANYIIQTSAISATQDTGYVLTGFVVQVLTNSVSNYLIKTDSIGVIQWSKLIDASASGLISQVNDVIERPNGDIVVSGKYFNTGTILVGDFMIYFDAEGNVVRQLDYLSDNSFFFLNSPQGLIQFTQGEMGNTVDGGILYSTVGFDPSSGTLSPYIIKTDLLGGAMCNDTLDFDLVSDFAFIRDTLTMGTDDYAVTDTLLLRERDYDNFTVPVLTLIDTAYCPQDPILQTIDATLQGATAYEWSTGETTSSIIVTEEGEYSVTVTVGEQICYMQCDTSTITKLELPEADINSSIMGICALEGAELTAVSTPPLQSLVWGDGQTTNPLIVSQPGSYSVTITDVCGNTAESSIQVDQITTGFQASIVGGDLTCTETSIEQTLQVVSNSTVDIESIEWNTGASTESIIGTESMTYTVTVINICGESSSAEFTVVDLDNALSLNPTVSNIFCESGQASVIISAGVTSSQDYTVMWSNGAVEDQIRVTEAGSYSVTVTNECDETQDASIEVADSDLDVQEPMPTISLEIDSCDFILRVDPGVQTNVIGSSPQILWSNMETADSIVVNELGIYSVEVTDGCGNIGIAELALEDDLALQFANLFFPQGEIDVNRSFGAIIKCPDTFNGENYVLEIFNRFGNKVFETDRVEGKWNGSFGGSPAPRDVYMYQYSYDTPDGIQQKGSGSITLMR